MVFLWFSYGFQVYPQETNQKPTNVDPAESLRRESSWPWPIQKYSHNLETACVCHKNAMKMVNYYRNPAKLQYVFYYRNSFRKTNTEQATKISYL